MFGYIASFLGFQGQSHSTNDNEGNHSVSCEGYGYSLPDPAVRLRLSRTNDSVVRIFGHPPQEDYPEAMNYPGSTMGTEGPPFVHYLYNPGPACLKYVMGDNNWRSRLTSGHQSRLRFLEGDVLLRPAFSGNSDDTCHSVADDDPAVEAEERAHSLRMRRCGAVAIFSENDIGDYETGWLYPPGGREYLFGWPKSGGVWVLRAPSRDPRPETLVGVRQTQQESMDSNMVRAKENRAFLAVAKSLKQQEDMEDRLPSSIWFIPPKPRLSDCVDDWELMQANLKEAEVYEAYGAVKRRVKQQEDMEDVCRVLKENEAQFYATIADCPEAIELNLS